MSLVEAWSGRVAWFDVAGEAVAVVDVPAASRDDQPALLVVHGFPTSSIDFQPIVDRLSQGRRVVLLDLPGYGLSAKPDRPYSLFGQADVVAAVAEGVGLREVDLLTHDMGDSVGGELLARSLEGGLPFEVRRRVLTNGSIYIDMAQLTEGQKAVRELPDEIMPDGTGPDLEALTGVLSVLCAPDRRSVVVDTRLRAAAELIVRDGGNRLLPRLIRYLDERDRHEARWTGAIEDHPAPLTVVWGRHDPVAVAAMAPRLVERTPGAALHWLDAGHWPMVELPDAFADAVLQALDDMP